MKVLVTGSSGTIGTRLCERLLKDGHTIIGVDWHENKWQPELDALTHIVDLRDQDATLAFAKQHLAGENRPDAVVHLAANARVYELVKNPDMARDNMLSTYNTLELTRQMEIPRFMFASSRENYGNQGQLVCTEDMVHLENCESAYSSSKVAGEAMTHAYRECYDIQTIIYRFSNVYGMYDDSDRFVPLLIRQARANDDITIFGEDKVLDFTYIDDTVDGIIAGLHSFDAANGRTFNLGNGEGTNLVDAAKKIIELIGSTSSISITSSRTGEVMQYVADITAAKDVLKYDPQAPFADGIAKTVEWYLAQ